ncbi:MAG TPA: LPS assembly lipoprotein LptE [Eoetvoesiella sp.]
MHSLQPRQSLLTLSSQAWLRGLACVLLCILLTACGFRLKGVDPLPFDTLYTNIEENSAFGAKIRRAIVASSPNTRFVSDPAQAQARLTQLANNQSLREVSIDARGQVEEYELNLEFIFQVTDAQGHLILPPTTLQTTREVPYDSNLLQAKQGEIGSLFQEMQQSLVDRVLRRLSSPDVAEAFKDSANQPLDLSPETTEPQNSGDNSQTPIPGSSPGVIPGARFF